MKQGYFLAFLAALFSGVAVFLNKFAVDFWKNSSAFTTAKNISVALILTLIVVILEKSNFSKISKKIWIKLSLLGLIGGSIPFLLFFKGLSLIPAADAAFIQKTLFIWVAILAYFFLKEKISVVQILALAILGVSILMLGKPNGIKFNYGELLVLLATLIWSCEAILVQKFTQEIPPTLAVWGRMFLGSIILLGYLAFRGSLHSVIPTNAGQLSWLLISVALLFGYVMTFYAAIRHASATVATSVLVIAAPVTILLNEIFVKNIPFAGVLLPLLTASAGLFILLTSKSNKKEVLNTNA